VPTKTKRSKKVQEPPANTTHQRCSFRMVQGKARSKGSGPFAVEARQPGSSVWTAGVVGLDLEYAVRQMATLETGGCPIEYNEYFPPPKKR